VKECLLGSISEESLSDSEFASENELDDTTLSPSMQTKNTLLRSLQ
jgi:hypothetical protein